MRLYRHQPERRGLRTQRSRMALPQPGCRWRVALEPAQLAGADQLHESPGRAPAAPPVLDRDLGDRTASSGPTTIPGGAFSGNCKFSAPTAPLQQESRRDNVFPGHWPARRARAGWRPARRGRTYSSQPRAWRNRDRKINLNYPLPSPTSRRADPAEVDPNTYGLMLKAILPPLAIDSPEEPPAEPVPDEHHRLPRPGRHDDALRQPRRLDGRPVPDGHPAIATLRPCVPVGPRTTQPLDQYGMEYNPVAINEVLAYSFHRKAAPNVGRPSKPTGRFFVELVNTLTKSNAHGGTTTDHHAVDLSPQPTWDIVLVPDDGTNRPTPPAGQFLAGPHRAQRSGTCLRPNPAGGGLVH